jgi:hypothetical protein
MFRSLNVVNFYKFINDIMNYSSLQFTTYRDTCNSVVCLFLWLTFFFTKNDVVMTNVTVFVWDSCKDLYWWYDCEISWSLFLEDQNWFLIYLNGFSLFLNVFDLPWIYIAIKVNINNEKKVLSIAKYWIILECCSFSPNLVKLWL